MDGHVGGSPLSAIVSNAAVNGVQIVQDRSLVMGAEKGKRLEGRVTRAARLT